MARALADSGDRLVGDDRWRATHPDHPITYDSLELDVLEVHADVMLSSIASEAQHRLEPFVGPTLPRAT